MDDEPMVLELTKSFLEREKTFDVDTATSAKSALEKISKKSYDAIVADYQMPDIDGLELLQIIRNQGRNISYILFTGKGREDVAIRALNYGADFYLQKGGDPNTQFAELSNMIVQSAGRRNAQDLLHESERRFREFLANAHHAAVILDKEGKIEFINEYLLRLAGREGENVLGRSWFDLFIPDDLRGDLKRMYDESISTEELTFSRPHVNDILVKDGTRKTLAWDNTVLLDREGRVSGVASLGEDITESEPGREAGADITELKLNQEKLQRLNEKLSLLGNITRHDVQNQLAVLLGWLDIAIADCKDEKSKNQLQSARTAANTIRDQLEFTADYQEMGVATPKWIGVKEALVQGTSTLTLAGVTVHSDLDGIEMFADPMIHKVFHNLVDNSLRHGKRVDTIRLHYAVSGDEAKVVYEDNGVGIPAKEKQLVFQQGFGKHTGYGLHLSKEILAITGIGIKETGVEGQGARFELVLPRASFRLLDQSGPRA